MTVSSNYEWFSDWVDQHLALTLTLARESDTAALLAAFGSTGFDQPDCSFDEADDLGVDVLRVGKVAGWSYGVEHFTTRGSEQPLLEQMSSGGGLALGVTFTETISTLMLARDGVLVTGFDMQLPDFRYGNDQHAYDREMREAGFQDGGPRRRGEPAARFIELVTGVVMTREMLEAPLPCATLPNIP